MRYILDCVNERGLNLELNKEYKYLSITIQSEDGYKVIFLDEDGIFELIGALHHIQKQIKSDK